MDYMDENLFAVCVYYLTNVSLLEWEKNIGYQPVKVETQYRTNLGLEIKLYDNPPNFWVECYSDYQPPILNHLLELVRQQTSNGPPFVE